MAINNKPAEKYAKPHTMSGKGVSGDLPAMSTQSGKDYMNESNISVGNISKSNYKPTKTTGVKQRGFGAATKGYTSRGPLA